MNTIVFESFVLESFGGKIMVITKQTLISEVLAEDIETAQFFFAIGMHCIGCPHSQGESIEEACMVHGTDPDELVNTLNLYLTEKAKAAEKN